MKVPTSYEELTVLQFQQIEELKKNKELALIDRAILKLSILTGKTVDELEDFEPNVIYNALLKAVFLNTPLTSVSLKSKVRIGLKTFKPIISLHELTTAQQKDFNQILEDNNKDYVACLPEILSIIHKELTITGYKYKSENHYKNVELFKAAKVGDVIGVVFFYSNCLSNYSRIIKDCLDESQTTIASFLNTIENDKEFQAFLSSGAGSIR